MFARNESDQKPNGRLIMLLQQYQQENDLLLAQELSSNEKVNKALQLFVSILQLNYQIINLGDQKGQIQEFNTQITAENFMLARLEKSIAADSKNIDLICGKLSKISKEIEVYSVFLTMIDGAKFWE
jgi:hypothetical protein